MPTKLQSFSLQWYSSDNTLNLRADLTSRKSAPILNEEENSSSLTTLSKYPYPICLWVFFLYHHHSSQH